MCTRQMAQYLEHVRCDRFSAWQIVAAAGAKDAAGLQVQVVLHRAQVISTAETDEKLRLEAHQAEQFQLEPAQQQVPPLPASRPCVQFSQAQEQEFPKQSILVVFGGGGVNQLANVRGPADAIQVCAQTLKAFDCFALCDDVPGAGLGCQEVSVVKRFQMTGFAARCSARPLGDQDSPSQLWGEDRQDAVRLAVIPSAKDHGSCAVGVATLCHRRLMPLISFATGAVPHLPDCARQSWAFTRGEATSDSQIERISKVRL